MLTTTLRTHPEELEDMRGYFEMILRADHPFYLSQIVLHLSALDRLARCADEVVVMVSGDHNLVPFHPIKDIYL